MGDALNRIALPMREIVHRVDAPGIAGAVVRGVQNTVHDRVAHVHIRRAHVNFRAQCAAAIGEFAGAHAREQPQVFFNGAFAVRAVFAWFGQSAAIFANFIRAEVVHVSLPLPDELKREFIKLLKIIRGVILAVAPVKTQPVNVLFDSIHIFRVFFNRIGVIVAQVCQPAVAFRYAKIDSKRFSVPDVQVAVWFRWKARMHPPAKAPGAVVFFDNFDNKVRFFQVLLVHLASFHALTQEL